MSEETFIGRLCAAVLGCNGGDAHARDLIGRSIADTLGVAAAGFVEPVAARTLAAYSQRAALTWSGARVESREAAIFVNAVAAHALDYDDVFLDSTIHPGAVILPAILQLDRPTEPDELIAAFGAGLIAARALARFVGAGHYFKGWHATGTYGAFAATAAAARLHRLNEQQLRAAFALAASQSGGVRLNFGTMAKPAHAGFAATAGVRAVRLAAAGVEAAHDIFVGQGGFASLYGTGDGDSQPDNDSFELRPDLLSVKLYPCCYAAHRLIGVCLDARVGLGELALNQRNTAVLEVPAGSLVAIENDNPATGLEAKFSAKYAVVTALFSGEAGLTRFTNEAMHRPGLTEELQRVEIVEDASQQSGNDIQMGEVRLRVHDGADRELGRFLRSTIPGSPASPPSRAELATKLAECLAVFERAHDGTFPALNFIENVKEAAVWLPSGGSTERAPAVAVQAS